MKILEIKHMKKSFGDLDVIRDISLSVEEGEVLSIIGPSGSGKSTLLRCAAMLENMDSGELVYLGEHAVHNDEHGHAAYAPKKDLRRIHKHFGLVFQSFNLFPHYTVLKNIMEAPMLVEGISRLEAEERAMTLLGKFGLSDKRDAYPHQLSGGQQQRVSIARALALQPKILFFDEPTSALDPELVGEVLKVIRNLADDGMTMMIVTHEMGFAAKVSDRVLFLADGCIEEQGPPAQLFHRPKSPRLQYFLSSWSERQSGTRLPETAFQESA